MLTEKEYHLVINCLKELQLEVKEEKGFTDFINYRSKNSLYTIYTISKTNRKYLVSTLLRMSECENIEEVLFVLRQDWSK